jgi:spore coat protein CotF
MSDKLYLENYLLVLKSTVEVFVHGTLESSNPDIRKTLKKGLDETLLSQANTYDEMSNYGWYSTDNVSPKDILKVYNKVNKEC